MPVTLETKAEQTVAKQLEAERANRVAAEVERLETEAQKKAEAAAERKRCKEIESELRPAVAELYESDAAVESLIIALIAECRKNVDRQNTVARLLATVGSNEIGSVGGGYRAIDKLWLYLMGRCKPLFQRLVPRVTNADAVRWGAMPPSERDRTMIANVAAKYKLDIQ